MKISCTIIVALLAASFVECRQLKGEMATTTTTTTRSLNHPEEDVKPAKEDEVSEADVDEDEEEEYLEGEEEFVEEEKEKDPSEEVSVKRKISHWTTVIVHYIMFRANLNELQL